MARYSDTFKRMQRPDQPFGYGDKDINEITPWQAPFGIASREINDDDAWELWCAATDGTTEIVERLVQGDKRLKDIAFRYHCPLDLAIYGGHSECVEVLLDAGTELSEKWGWYGWKRMLTFAIDMGYPEIHDMMLRHIKQKSNYHPDIQLLIDALCKQDIARMAELIDDDPGRVAIADEAGNTALHWAVVSRQLPMIELLIERGADPSRRNGAHAMPHQVKMWTQLEKELIRGLEDSKHYRAARARPLELGAEVDFHTAIWQKNFDLVQQMLTDDSNLVHHMPGHLGSPLNTAVGNVEMLQLLLERGADPNMTEHTAPFGRALYSAVARNEFESARLLLEHGAEPMQYSDSSGDTLFAANLWIENDQDKKRMIDLINHYTGNEYIVIPTRNDDPEHEVTAAAVREVLSGESVTDWQIGHLLEVILLYQDIDLFDEYLARFGSEAKSRIANVDARQHQGPMLDRLTELGARAKPVNIQPIWMGATELHWNTNIELVAEFVQAGGDINSINLERQRTALSNAAERGDLKMVRELLKHGADPNLPARYSANQPLKLAKKHGHKKIVKLLRDHIT